MGVVTGPVGGQLHQPAAPSARLRHGPAQQRLPQPGAAAVGPVTEGELTVGGIALSPGYVNRPDLTAKAFIEDTHRIADNPSGRLYRTGDLGRIDENDEVEYLGRIDLQVGDMLPMVDWTMNSEDGACCELVGEPITDPAFVGEGVGIAMRKGQDDLRGRINAALAEMRADGAYKALNDKYFPIDVYTLK